MAVKRETLKWQKPDIQAETVKAFGLMDEMAKYIYKHEDTFPADKYEDIADNMMIPSMLFWSDQDLYYTIRQSINPPYVQRFWEMDVKAPLRGNYKRTEVGEIFPEIIKDEHEKKPGQPLVTPKQKYVPFIQDQCAPIQDIHARTFVDWHQFDFAVQFNSFADYNRVVQMIWNVLAKANARLAKLLVDTFIVSLFGGFLHCYPTGHRLYRFFGSKKDDVVPDKEFSEMAHEFFGGKDNEDGEVRKRIQELAKWVGKWYKARVGYLTNVLEHEVIGQNNNKTVAKFADCKVDLSTKEKALEAMRHWYLDTDSSSKYTKTGHTLRRISLYAFASALDGTIYDLTQDDTKNWCGYDFYADTNKDKSALSMQALPQDLIVFMNNEDLSEIRFGLKGSEASGVFTEAFNGKIERWEKQGVTFYGLNFVPPGTAAIVDKLAFSIKEYFHGDYSQFHAYDLVESRIKHLYVKPVLYQKVVARVIHPAKDQKYAVPSYWGSKNLSFIAQHD